MLRTSKSPNSCRLPWREMRERVPRLGNMLQGIDRKLRNKIAYVDGDGGGMTKVRSSYFGIGLRHSELSSTTIK